jgi:hypothetical protein
LSPIIPSIPVLAGLLKSFHTTQASHKETRKSGIEREAAWPGGKKKKSTKAITGRKKRI